MRLGWIAGRHLTGTSAGNLLRWRPPRCVRARDAAAVLLLPAARRDPVEWAVTPRACARAEPHEARDPAPHYQHSEVGYNYRLSNILAGVGRAQLKVLGERVAQKRNIFSFYQCALKNEPGIEFMPEAPYGRSTRWLTCIIVHPEKFGATREEIRLHLDKKNIEARPLWKPMHLQPIFQEYRCRGGTVAEFLFENGLCLPSGSNLTEDQLEKTAQAILSVPRFGDVR